MSDSMEKFSQIQPIKSVPEQLPKQQESLSEPPKLRAFRSRFSLFGTAAAVYALFYTFCLYKNASGITYPFFVAGTLCYFGFCMKKCKVPFKKDAIFYVISLLLLGISVFLTADPKILWMTKAGIFLLFISFLLHHFYRDEEWGIFQYLWSIVHSVFEAVICLGAPFRDCFLWITHREGDESLKKWRYILLGLSAGLPLLAVILILLMFADRMFKQFVDQLIGGLNFSNGFGICFMAIAVFAGVYALFVSLLRHRVKEESREVKKTEPLLAITITLPIAVVYLIFCGIQVVYLFGRFAQLPEEYTWSSYARQGFFQLLAVCLINLVLVCVCLYRFRESRVLRGLLAAICLMTYIMIASSAYRMILYIQVYYLTFLRLFVLWALLVIALIITGVLAAVLKTGFPLFRYCMVMVTVCYICLAFAKPDYWIAKYNMAHTDLTALASGEFIPDDFDYRDVYYLSRLSADAAPILMEETYQEALLSGHGSDSMRRYYSKVAQEAEEMSWRQFNLSRWLVRIFQF